MARRTALADPPARLESRRNAEDVEWLPANWSPMPLSAARAIVAEQNAWHGFEKWRAVKVEAR